MAKELTRALVVAVLIVAPVSALAEGFVVYSSWSTQARADSEAAWTSTQLNVSATVKAATVEGVTVYRVVAEVHTGMVGVEFLDSAREAGWEDVWYEQASDESWNVELTNTQEQAQAAPVADSIAETEQQGSPIGNVVAQAPAEEPSDVEPQVSAEEPSDVEPQVSIETPSDADTQTPAEEVVASDPVQSTQSDGVEVEDIEPDEGSEGVAPSGGESDALAAESGVSTPTIEDFAGIDQVTVDQTLREVEEIQKRAQQMISEWMPRQEQSFYDPRDVLSVNTATDSEAENQEADASSGFNVLTLPPRRRR